MKTRYQILTQLCSVYFQEWNEDHAKVALWQQSSWIRMTGHFDFSSLKVVTKRGTRKWGSASEGNAFGLVFFSKLCFLGLNLLAVAWNKGLKSLAWFTLKFGELCVRFERNQKLDCCWIVVEVTDNNEPSTISHCFLSKIVFASSAAAAHLWAVARNGGKGNKSIDRLNYPPSTALFGAPIKTSYCNCCFFFEMSVCATGWAGGGWQTIISWPALGIKILRSVSRSELFSPPK